MQKRRKLLPISEQALLRLLNTYVIALYRKKFFPGELMRAKRVLASGISQLFKELAEAREALKKGTEAVPVQRKKIHNKDEAKLPSAQSSFNVYDFFND